MKVLHLFLKNEFLFSGIEKFLAIFTKCAVKTHAEGVAESMGNYVDIHSEKRRGLARRLTFTGMVHQCTCQTALESVALTATLLEDPAGGL